jgi:predicted flap endonuclease-1-like 5' DNA nuclease
MTFLIAEMVLCLLAAAALGLSLGWLLRSLGVRAKFEASEQLWSRRLRVADDEIAARSAELAEVEGSLEEKTELLNAAMRNEHSLVEGLGDLERQVGLLKDESEAKETAVRGLSAEVAALQSALLRSNQEVAAGRSALAATGVDLERALDRIRELEHGLAESNTREGVLEDTVQATRQSAEQLERRLADMKSDVENALTQLDHESSRVRFLQSRLSEGESIAAELMVERDALIAARESQAGVLADKDREVTTLQKWLSERSAQIENIASQSHSTDEMLAMLEEQLLNRDSDLSALRTELAESEAAIASLEGSNQHLRSVVADLEEQLGGQATPTSSEDNTRLAALQDKLVASGETIDRLSREVRSLEARSLALEGEVQQRRLSGKRLDDELAAARKRHADGEARINLLHERIAELEREAAPPKSAQSAERPRVLLDRPKGAPDDLKQIRGIGKKLEKMLHRLGVFHFSQIASFTEDDVRWVADNLEVFPDRVFRDDWITQASVLLNGSPTNSVSESEGTRQTSGGVQAQP